jgi:crotonobetainyl-CoA:carnitine CoA-transferase CaiB-like acyl-CoA transferase
VIALEPPAGSPLRRPPWLGGTPDPERSLAWLALQTSKRGGVLDLDDPAGRARYRSLLAGADVVLESFAPGWLAQRGLDHADLAPEHPRLVHCAITPFGRSGPYAGFRGGDLVCVAMGGNLGMTGEPDRPPVRCSMPTAFYHAGPEAALGVLLALIQREDTGRGQLVDVSLHETQLQTLLGGAGQRSGGAALGRRAGARLGNTREIWPAKDGMVSFGLRGGASRVGSLRATVELMAERGMAPDWLRDYDWEHYTPFEASPEELARLEAAFGAFFAAHSMHELYREALARRILLAPCNDAREILRHEQLRARELFRRIDYPELGASIEHPDGFAKLRPAPVRIRRRAPRRGEHDAELDAELAAPPPDRAAAPPASAAPGPVLRGLKVLEVGSGAAGPVATK